MISRIDDGNLRVAALSNRDDGIASIAALYSGILSSLDKSYGELWINPPGIIKRISSSADPDQTLEYFRFGSCQLKGHASTLRQRNQPRLFQSEAKLLLHMFQDKMDISFAVTEVAIRPVNLP